MRYVEPLLAMFFLASSAFFSAVETALVTLSVQKTKHLAIRNPKLTHHLIGWLTRPHELITTILVGNTISVIMFAALLTSAALKIFSPYPKTYIELTSWFVQTFLMLILGEMAPKFLGRIYPERISLTALPVLEWMRRVCEPIIRVITRIIGLFIPTASMPTSSYLTFSMEELRLLLEESPPPNVQKESLSMMQKALDLANKTAEQIMTRIENLDYVDLDSGASRDEMIDLIIENGHTRTPVRRNKDFIGYIHTHDLLALIVEDRGQDLASLVLAAHVLSPTMRVNELLQLFKSSSVHVGFVQKDNKVIGLVTLEDVMEEITGEILDEYDLGAANK